MIVFIALLYLCVMEMPIYTFYKLVICFYWLHDKISAYFSKYDYSYDDLRFQIKWNNVLLE